MYFFSLLSSKLNKVLFVSIAFFLVFESYAQNSNFIKLDPESLSNSVLLQSLYPNNYSFFNIDTNDYSVSLNLFRRRKDLFDENKSYFFVTNESLINQLAIHDFDLLFNQYQTEPLKIFIKQHSSSVSYSLSEFENSSFINKVIKLSSGNDVFIKKDFGSLMITDNKNFESIISGHMYLNNCSIFFIQLLLK